MQLGQNCTHLGETGDRDWLIAQVGLSWDSRSVSDKMVLVVILLHKQAM